MKTKTYFSLMLSVGLLALTATSMQAQVGINNTGATPNASAILDLQTGNAGVNKGFLPQSVALTDVTVAAPVTSPATGLIVYSSTAPTGGSGTGYYYWNGTAWTGLGGGGGGGSLTGSGATDYVAVWTNATNLGTGLIQDNGADVGINTTPYAGDMLYVVAPSGWAIDGFTADATYYGVGGYNSLGVGTYGDGATYGVYGECTYAAGSGGYFTDGTEYAAIGDVTNQNGVTAYGAGNGGVFSDVAGDYSDVANNSGGYGIYSYGTYVGGYFTDPSGVEVWIGDGSADNCAANMYDPAATEEARMADGNTLSGVYGFSSNTTGYGLYGYNGYVTDGTGVGVYGGGSGAIAYPISTLCAAGNYPGVYAEGIAIGIFAYADNNTSSTDEVWPVYGANDGGARWASLALWDGTTDYKAYGTGTVATLVKDNSNITRVMNCPEAPEILFEDYGTGTLNNGKVHVDLDPTYAKNVTINEKHALRVLITLNDECNGVFVTNRTTTGFDVVELNHGTSNASFTYEVIANRADTYDSNGKLLSKNADNRFVKGVSALDKQTVSASTRKTNDIQRQQRPVKPASTIKPAVPLHPASSAGVNQPNTKNSK